MKINRFFYNDKLIVICVALLTISNAVVTSFSIGSSIHLVRQRRGQQQHDVTALISNGDKLEDPSSFSTTSKSVVGMSSSSNSDGSPALTFPPLKESPPRKICLMVEPTPFTHISGYSNRFNYMLKFLKEAGDDVKIMTVDQQTPKDERPKDKFGYKITHTHGFTMPMYKHIALSLDLQMKGRKVIKSFLPDKPDLIHVASP